MFFNVRFKNPLNTVYTRIYNHWFTLDIAGGKPLVSAVHDPGQFTKTSICHVLSIVVTGYTPVGYGAYCL